METAGNVATRTVEERQSTPLSLLQVTVCQERGGVGTIIFLEPTLPNVKEFYPNSTIVDGSALQRGALFTFADPETPGYPSVGKRVHRKREIFRFLGTQC